MSPSGPDGFCVIEKADARSELSSETGRLCVPLIPAAALSPAPGGDGKGAFAGSRLPFFEKNAA